MIVKICSKWKKYQTFYSYFFRKSSLLIVCALLRAIIFFIPKTVLHSNWTMIQTVLQEMSRLMRKATKWVSAQSDQSSLCAQWVAKDPKFLHVDSEDWSGHGICPGWSESSLAAQSFCWFCHVAAQMLFTAFPVKGITSSMLGKQVNRCWKEWTDKFETNNFKDPAF